MERYAPHRNFRDAFILLAALCSVTTLLDMVLEPDSIAWAATRLVLTAMLVAVIAAWGLTALRRSHFGGTSK